jgi:malonyl-CoA/methylmalonyl-CoA synthetase
MILYTSGTTSKPKGVVLTHKNIQSQITTLIEAWGWLKEDHILHILPLHHTHGIINALLCALWSGASCEMLPKFDTKVMWERFVQGNVSIFMAVPTIYYRLISYWEEASEDDQKKMSDAASKLRLMVSGSAALPVQTFEKWERITGHRLLERYGMTEIGMALSNPLSGERRPGFVGTPLPGVTARLVDDKNEEITEEGVPGEIQIKGSNVFKEYWKKPEATEEVFKEGWFCTGDAAVLENGYFKILGRNSVDIIKTGGYKVSALEIEEVLRTHPQIRECAVVGIEDPEWGERVAVAVVANSGKSLQLDDLRDWAKNKLAVYKIPSRLLVLQELPRNTMGKVTKQELKQLLIDSVVF